jgi:glycosyltransferase involved in cell wall biosynthesis
MPGKTLEGTPILAFAKDRWNGNWFNRHHLLSRISRHNPVLYVSEPFHIRQTLHDLKNREWGATGLRKVSETLHEYIAPRWLPLNYRIGVMNRAARQRQVRQIRSALKQLGMSKPILYIWDPEFADMIGQFDESLVVYHCYDEHVDFPGTTEEERRTIIAQEQQILSRADIVFAVSSSIYERKHALNPNTFIVRNAADYDLFAAARDPETKIPEDVKNIPHPMIGCVTRIVDQYFNVPLMCEVFTRRPDWSLVVVGPTIEPQGDNARAAEQRIHLDALRSLPNVHLVGRREQKELPGYLKAFDVCAMAYPMIENVMHSESPLKMYEYLAAGKPIVSTPLPLIAHLSDVISFARDAKEWIEAIEIALRDRDPQKVEERQKIAQVNTWDSRASFVSAKLAEELAR